MEDLMIHIIRSANQGGAAVLYEAKNIKFDI